MQASHAVAEFYKQCPEAAKHWDNQYLIILKVPRIEVLDEWFKMCRKIEPEEGFYAERTAIAKFCEPDLNNDMTAFAVYGLEAEIFDLLKLW